MCGLAGEVRLDGSRADVGAVERMAATMSDRGPDDSGSWSRGRVALSHRRLKVIDLSGASGQPIVDSAAGLTAVFNGCIYNYRELRAKLAARGHSFFSRGDSEVVLKAYSEWGLDFASHLIGMFAIAIAEHDTGRVVLARDRLGIKPLYLAQTPSAVRFASTLPALLAGAPADDPIDTSIDPQALVHYLTFHSVVPSPRTILNGVKKLPPATVRVYEPDGELHEHVYWTVDFSRSTERADWTPTDWQDALLDALRTAVRRRMVADVPVGVLLSGGLDSSLVVALLAEHGQRGLATFSIGFDSVAGRIGDEFRHSNLIARTFGTDHRQLTVASADLLAPLERTVKAMSEPMVSHDCVAFYLLSEAVSRQLKVVQSGQGADEILAGYHWYPPLAQVPRDQAADTYARAFFDTDAAGLTRMINPEFLRARGSGLDSSPLGSGLLDSARNYVGAQFARPGAQTAVDAGLRIDTTVMLVDDPVKRLDNMTMAHGLEARTPFLDHEFVELAASCPPELKLAQGGKGILKEIGRGLLPWSVIDRQKGYFPVPGLTHLEGKLLARVTDALDSAPARERQLFRPEYVAHLLTEPNAELTPLQGNKLWQLGLLELWLQSHNL
jgi:asparagine synthase (glutamine-hydrolysing)